MGWSGETILFFLIEEGRRVKLYGRGLEDYRRRLEERRSGVEDENYYAIAKHEIPRYERRRSRTGVHFPESRVIESRRTGGSGLPGSPAIFIVDSFLSL